MAEVQSERSFVSKAVDWLREQHARRFIVEKDGRVAVDLPLTVFAVGAVMGLHVAILGLILAFVTRHEVHVETPETEELDAGTPGGDAGPTDAVPGSTNEESGPSFE